MAQQVQLVQQTKVIITDLSDFYSSVNGYQTRFCPLVVDYSSSMWW